MHATSLTIEGYRGFSAPQTLQLAQPNGRLGSGLTILVGPNGGGKSSVLEALGLCGDIGYPMHLNRERRNQKRERRVRVSITYSDGRSRTICTAAQGGSAMVEDGAPSIASILVVPSRRSFSALFPHQRYSREEYSRGLAATPPRTGTLQSFTARLFKAREDDYRDRFDATLAKLINPPPKWVLEATDNHQHLTEFFSDTGEHSTDGMGEGVLSALVLADALYDIDPPQIAAIDEPELSLHPQLQRRAMRLLMEASCKAQIVISTHSPHFVELEALRNGATLSRVFVHDGQCVIRQLSTEALQALDQLTANLNNPHLLGLDTKNVFFVADRIVLVEGQEDVVFYKERVLPDLDIDLQGDFFGWGVGGKDNMAFFMRALRDLGFSRVGAILDGNAQDVKSKLREQFDAYFVECIPADDVRAKKEKPITSLLDSENMHVRSEYRMTSLVPVWTLRRRRDRGVDQTRLWSRSPGSGMRWPARPA